MTETNDATETDETNSADEYRDDRGLAGRAVAVTRVETGEREPGIVQGARDITLGDEIVATRVLVDVETADHPIETDAERVEVV